MPHLSLLDHLHARVYEERVKYWRAGHRWPCRKAEQKMIDYLTCAEIPTAAGWLTKWGVPVWRCARCGVHYPALKPLTGYGWPLRNQSQRARERNPTVGEAGSPPPGNENDESGTSIARDDDGEPVCRGGDSDATRES